MLKKFFNKIIIFGAGNVGATLASILINNNYSTSILLFDPNQKRLIAQVLDLQDQATFQNYIGKVDVANWNDCNNADAIIITAGYKQNPGQSRDDLAQKNAQIVRQIIDKINQTKFQGFLIVVTNPVDQMTYLVHRLSKLPSHKIIGTGTSIDTVRFIKLLAQKFPSKKHNLVVYGEHGVNVLISTISNDLFANQTINYDEYKNKIITIPQKIIDGKNATYYGISSIIYKIILQLNQPRPLQLNLGVLMNNCVIGHPSQINYLGVLPIAPIFTKEEIKKFQDIFQKMYQKQQKIWKYIQSC